MAALLSGLIILRIQRAQLEYREDRKKEFDMARGSVTKLVTTFGSTWGRIRRNGGSRDVFFNAAAIEKLGGFSSLEVGQDVEFDECPDFVNGSHAEHVVVTSSPPHEAAGEASEKS